MYRTLPALWEGWTKNLTLLLPETLQLAARRGIEFLVASAGIAAVVIGLLFGHPVLAAAGVLAAVPT
jgi:hypothetical protein